MGMLAEELQAEIEIRGWSQREAAKKLGVSEADVSRWVNGVRRTPHWLPLALKGIDRPSIPAKKGKR